MLKDKWALVTGATAGLGLTLAESLAGAGANVVLHDLAEPREAGASIRSRFGTDVVSVVDGVVVLDVDVNGEEE